MKGRCITLGSSEKQTQESLCMYLFMNCKELAHMVTDAEN